MREHYKSNCYVSNDGLHVERDYFDPKLLRKRVQELTTHLDAAEDRFYVLVSGKGKFYIDEMVLACYRGTMKDGKKYLVHHIDGDMRNSEVFEVGTSNQISLLSMISGIEFIMAHGMKTVADAVSAKVEKIKYSLAEMNHLKLLSPLGQRTGNAVSFNIDGLLPSDVASILLDSFGIIVRSGLMCSPFAFGRGFPAGAVRVSPAFLTPDSDIDAFISAMREIDRGL